MTHQLNEQTKEAYFAYMNDINTPLEYREITSMDQEWMPTKTFELYPDLEYRIAKPKRHPHSKFMSMVLDNKDYKFEVSFDNGKTWEIHNDNGFDLDLQYRVKSELPDVKGKFFMWSNPHDLSNYYVVLATGPATWWGSPTENNAVFSGVIVKADTKSSIGNIIVDYLFDNFTEVSAEFK